MVNINFVPDDYIQSNESRRTNLMYLVLLGMMMTAIGLSFITIKIQQRALSAKEQLVNAKMAQVRKKIKQSEKLRAKAKILKETALTVSELLEAVPRSVLLASLTNNLPRGVSLLRLNLIQKEPKKTRHTTAHRQLINMRPQRPKKMRRLSRKHQKKNR